MNLHSFPGVILAAAVLISASACSSHKVPDSSGASAENLDPTQKQTTAKPKTTASALSAGDLEREKFLREWALVNAVDPSRKILAQASASGIFFYDALKGKLIGRARIPKEADGSPPTTMAFSSNGRSLAVAFPIFNKTTGNITDSAIYFYQTGAREFNPTPIETASKPLASGRVDGLAYRAHDTILVTSTNHSVGEWDIATRQFAKRLYYGAGIATSSRDGKYFAASLDPGGQSAIEWNFTSNKPDNQWSTVFLPPCDPDCRVSAIAFNPDASIVATGDSSGRIALWSVATGKLIQTAGKPGAEVTGLDFSPDSALISSTSFDDSSVRVWATSSGHLALRIQNKAPTWGVYFTSAKEIVTSSEDKALRWWQVAQ